MFIFLCDYCFTTDHKPLLNTVDVFFQNRRTCGRLELLKVKTTTLHVSHGFLKLRQKILSKCGGLLVT